MEGSLGLGQTNQMGVKGQERVGRTEGSGVNEAEALG